VGLSTKITQLRNDENLTDADKEKMGTDGQVMLVKTLVTENGGVPITQHMTEFYNTVEEAEAEAAKWKSG
tara:strand:- start:249 stop:458 length:210 start_codon:yes stop_codon:yes gene_type:complete